MEKLDNSTIENGFYSSNNIEQYNYHNNIEVLYIKSYSYIVDIDTILTQHFAKNINMIHTIVILSGSLSLSIDYVRFKFEKNTAINVVSLMMVNNFEISEDFSCYIITSNQDFVNEVLMGSSPIPLSYISKMNENPGVALDLDSVQLLRSTIIRITYYLKLKSHIFQKELITNTYHNFILELANIITKVFEDDAPAKKTTRKEGLIRDFIFLLSEYGKCEHSPSFYAEKLAISTQYLSSILKEASGATAGNWIATNLVTQAKILLRTKDLTIQQVALELNFADQASFGKFFKKHTGVSPKKFR